jgi:hypothetical protein
MNLKIKIYIKHLDSGEVKVREFNTTMSNYKKLMKKMDSKKIEFGLQIVDIKKVEA